MAYKYKLNEMSKTASPEQAEKELGTPKEKFEIGQVSYSDDGQRKSTIYKIDPVTGAIGWKIEQLPGFDLLYDEIDALVDISKRVYVKTKDDKKFREIYDDVRKIRNKIRTHLRNEYPEEYKRITRIGEGDVDEISMSGAAGAYLTPYAFRIPKKKKKKKVKEDYRGVEFEEYIDELEKTMYVERRDRGRFIIHPLDKPDVNRPSGNYIVIDDNNVTAVQGYNSGPISVLADRYGLDDADSRMTPMGKTNADGRVSLLSSNILKDAIKAIRDSRDVEAKRQQDYYKSRGPVSGVGNLDEGVGADLGPGPKAGPDGVTNSAYTNQFKYKLVKKNKDGTYVQKRSSMPVRKLWGE